MSVMQRDQLLEPGILQHCVCVTISTEAQYVIFFLLLLLMGIILGIVEGYLLKTIYHNIILKIDEFLKFSN